MGVGGNLGKRSDEVLIKLSSFLKVFLSSWSPSLVRCVWFLFVLIFIYLAASGLSCGAWGL